MVASPASLSYQNKTRKPPRSTSQPPPTLSYPSSIRVVRPLLDLHTKIPMYRYALAEVPSRCRAKAWREGAGNVEIVDLRRNIRRSLTPLPANGADLSTQTPIDARPQPG